MPTSFATSENTFSTMKGIQQFLRSTMGDGRLSSLGLMLAHRSFDIGMEDRICAYKN
jgi:hypothetical protein